MMSQASDCFLRLSDLGQVMTDVARELSTYKALRLDSLEGRQGELYDDFRLFIEAFNAELDKLHESLPDTEVESKSTDVVESESE